MCPTSIVDVASEEEVEDITPDHTWYAFTTIRQDIPSASVEIDCAIHLRATSPTTTIIMLLPRFISPITTSSLKMSKSLKRPLFSLYPTSRGAALTAGAQTQVLRGT